MIEHVLVGVALVLGTAGGWALARRRRRGTAGDGVHRILLPFTGTAAQIPTHAGPLRFDRTAFIAKCHSVGLRVDFWVIDEPAEAKRLLDLGADGIMTNDPAKLRSVFA